ncbi:MAG: hypothetical protein QXM37_03065 [Candidatus Bathyarchaeia archaeon]
MKNVALKKSVVYTVDLAEIEGDGDFPCPKCGVIISPDDETEEIYQIVDTKLEGDNLAELVIRCNKCGSMIRLVGFLLEI